MKISCPNCQSAITGSDLNAETDVALCRNCDEAFSLADLVAAGRETDPVDLTQPPRGAWFEETMSGWSVGATTRSAVALFLVPFTCVWAGGSMTGIYGTQIAKGEFNLVMSLFGLPFLAGSIFLVSMTLMTIAGKVVVSVDRDVGKVFTGVGRIGWTRSFDWSSVVKIEEDLLSYRQTGSSGATIAVIGKTRLKLGSMLSDERRYFVLQTLRKQLASRRLSSFKM